jgi:hypothetical protein
MRVAEDRAKWREVRDLCLAVDCCGLMMMMMIKKKGIKAKNKIDTRLSLTILKFSTKIFKILYNVTSISILS